MAQQGVAEELHGDRKIFSVPVGLKCLLEEMSRETLRQQPTNINEFLANYLEEKLRRQGDCGKEGDYKIQNSIEKQTDDSSKGDLDLVPQRGLNQDQYIPTCGGPSGEFAPETTNTGTTQLDPNLVRGQGISFNREAPFGYGPDGKTPCVPFGRDRNGFILTALNPTAPFGFHPIDGLPVATNDPTAPFGFSPSGNPLTVRDPMALLGYDVNGRPNISPETVTFCEDSIHDLTNTILFGDGNASDSKIVGQSNQREILSTSNMTGNNQTQSTNIKFGNVTESQNNEECILDESQPKNLIDSTVTPTIEFQQVNNGQTQFNQATAQGRLNQDQSGQSNLSNSMTSSKGENSNIRSIEQGTFGGSSGQPRQQREQKSGEVIANVNLETSLRSQKTSSGIENEKKDESKNQEMVNENVKGSDGQNSQTTAATATATLNCGPESGPSEQSGLMYIGGGGASMLLSYDPSRVTSVQPPINHMANACTCLQVGNQVGVIDCAEIIRQGVESVLCRVMSVMSGIISQNRCTPLPNNTGVIQLCNPNPGSTDQTNSQQNDGLTSQIQNQNQDQSQLLLRESGQNSIQIQGSSVNPQEIPLDKSQESNCLINLDIDHPAQQQQVNLPSESQSLVGTQRNNLKTGSTVPSKINDGEISMDKNQVPIMEQLSLESCILESDPELSIGQPQLSTNQSKSKSKGQSEIMDGSSPSLESCELELESNSQIPNQSVKPIKSKSNAPGSYRQPSRNPIQTDVSGRRRRCIPESLRPYAPGAYGTCGTSALQSSSVQGPSSSWPGQGQSQGQGYSKCPTISQTDCPPTIVTEYKSVKLTSVTPCCVTTLENTTEFTKTTGTCTKCQNLCAQKWCKHQSISPPIPPRRQMNNRLASLQLTKLATTTNMGNYIEGILTRANDIMKTCVCNGSAGSSSLPQNPSVTEPSLDQYGRPKCGADSSGNKNLGKTLQELAPDMTDMSEFHNCPLTSDEQTTFHLLTTVGTLLGTIEATGLTQMNPVNMNSCKTLGDLVQVAEKLLTGLRQHLAKLAATNSLSLGPIKVGSDCDSSNLYMAQVTREAHEALGVSGESLEVAVGILKDAMKACEAMNGDVKLIEMISNDLNVMRNQYDKIDVNGIDPNETSQQEPTKLNSIDMVGLDTTMSFGSNDTTDLTATRNLDLTTTSPVTLNSVGIDTQVATLNSDGMVTDPATLYSSGTDDYSNAFDKAGTDVDPETLNLSGTNSRQILNTEMDNIKLSDVGVSTEHTKVIATGEQTQNMDEIITGTEPNRLEVDNENTQTWVLKVDRQNGPGSPVESVTGNFGVETTSFSSQDSDSTDSTLEDTGADSGSERSTQSQDSGQIFELEVGANKKPGLAGQMSKSKTQFRPEEKSTLNSVPRNQDQILINADDNELPLITMVDEAGRTILLNVDNDHQMLAAVQRSLRSTGENGQEHWSGNVGRFMTSHMTSVQNLLSGQTPISEARGQIAFLTVSFVVGVLVGYAVARSVGLLGLCDNNRTSTLLTSQSRAIETCQICEATAVNIESGKCTTVQVPTCGTS